jgi:hypothetical protein
MLSGRVVAFDDFGSARVLISSEISSAGKSAAQTNAMVIRMRRLLYALVALVLGTCAAVLAAPAMASATSLPAAAAAAPAQCPTYPFGPGPSVSISTTNPFPGQSVTITGANFNKNAHVTVVMSPPTVTLGSATTSASGSFTLHLTVPTNATGTKTITVVGGAPAGCAPNTIAIHIQTTVGPPGNHLSNTGVEIAAIIAVALALLIGGVLFATVGRRRNSHV